jgi:hypothetical protein
LHGVTIKLSGEKLNPHWKVSCRAWATTTRSIPLIEDFAVFQQLHGKPFDIFRAITLPTCQWSGTGGENVVVAMQKTTVQCNYIWIPLRPDP